jgi:hypothetical protein
MQRQKQGNSFKLWKENVTGGEGRIILKWVLEN